MEPIDCATAHYNRQGPIDAAYNSVISNPNSTQAERDAAAATYRADSNANWETYLACLAAQGGGGQ